MNTPRRLVIGVGQEQRGDDAVGLLVARHLGELDAAAGAGDLAIVEHDGDGMDLVLAWEGVPTVVVVDAVVSGACAPGEVQRFEAHREPLPARLFAGHSTHALGVADAIELSRAMESLPPSIVVYGIEAERFDTGSAPSVPVLRAIGPVAERVLEELGLVAMEGARRDA